MDIAPVLELRARQSQGTSADPIYQAVANVLATQRAGGGTLVDFGCGTGNLWRYLEARFTRYIGVDVVHYDGFPASGELHEIDLDTGRTDLPEEIADVVVAVETIEHLENPRAFMRELTRVCRQGGWIVITTPNQLSLLSKLTLVFKNQFNAFQDVSYPAHLTALLEADLRRISAECGLLNVSIAYTESGRIPGTAAHYPAWLSRTFQRSLSDNVILAARKPDQHDRHETFT